MFHEKALVKLQLKHIEFLLISFYEGSLIRKNELAIATVIMNLKKRCRKETAIN